MKKRFQLLVIATIIMTCSVGVNAQWQHPFPQGNHLFSVNCITPSRAFIAGGAETILRSDNTGLTWEMRSSLVMEHGRQLHAVHFSDINTNVGMAVGGWYNPYLERTNHSVYSETPLYTTTDGGNTWTYIGNLPANGGVSTAWRELYSIQFQPGSMTSIVIGGGASLLRTTNMGQNWNIPVFAGTNTPITTVTIRDIHFRSTNMGFAVGSGTGPNSTVGNLLQTSDGGATWQLRAIADNTALHGIDVNSGGTGSLCVAVGSGGLVSESNDGGTNWNTVTPAFNPLAFSQVHSYTSHLYSVSFAGNSNAAIAVGDWGVIMIRNAQTGAWTQVYSGTQEKLTSVDFFDNSNGIIVGMYGTVLRTSDGGLSWSVISGMHRNCLNGVYFTNVSQGIVVGDFGTIMRTTNGGTTWNNIVSGTQKSLYGVHFSSALVGTVVGDGGTILRTMDGGSSWCAQYSGVKKHLKSVSFVDQNNGAAVGIHGTLLYTTDGGGRWLPSTVTGSWAKRNVTTLHSVHLINGRGTAVGSHGTILSTMDNGQTWSAVEHTSTTNFTPYYRTVQQVSAGDFYAMGEQYNLIPGNGGATIMTMKRNGFPANSPPVSYQTATMTSPVTLVYKDWVYGIHFPVNANEGFAVGHNGTIVRTADGGFHWTVQNSGTRWSLRGVHFPSATTGYAVGMNGTILRTTDGGTYWGRIDPPGPVPILTGVNENTDHGMQQSITLVNAPNPVYGTTDISFTTSVASNITMRLYDNLGNELRVLVNEFKAPGQYTIPLDCSALPSGTYFCRLEAGTSVLTREIVVVK